MTVAALLLALMMVFGLPSGAALAQQGGPPARPHIQLFVVYTWENSAEVCFRAEFPAGEAGQGRAAALAGQLRDSGWDAEVVPREGLTAVNAVSRPAGGRASSLVAALPPAISGDAGSLQCDVEDRIVYSVRSFQLRYSPALALLQALSDSETAAGDGAPSQEPPVDLAATVSLTVELPGLVLGTDAEARAGKALYWELDWTPGSALCAGAQTVSVHAANAGLMAGGALVLALVILFLVDEVRSSRRARHGPKRRRPAAPAGEAAPGRSRPS